MSRIVQRLQQRRGTAADWTAADEILLPAELGVETDTGKFKIGDGTSHWGALPYFAGGGGGGGSTVFLNADATGVTDAAPAVQAAYDAGATAVWLQPGGIYYWNSPVFLDATSSERRFEIYMDGATIKLGSGLPTTAAYTTDATTKWAIFPGTKRSALSSGVVTVTSGNSSVGDTTWGGLVVRGGRIDGQATNVGFAFGNLTSCHFYDVKLDGARVLNSWTGYVDGNAYRSCMLTHPFNSDSFIVDQITNGDAVIIESCHAVSAGGVARLRHNAGAVISGEVGGAIIIIESISVVVMTSHVEGQQTARSQTPITICGSQVTFLGFHGQRDSAARWPVITIDDSLVGSDRISQIVFRDSHSTVYLPKTYADTLFGDFINIHALNVGSTITADNLTPSLGVGSSSQSFLGGYVPISSDDTNVAAGLSNGANAINLGSWYLAATSATSWEVNAYAGLPGLRVSRSRPRLPTPTLTAFTTGSTAPDNLNGGTLTSGTTYNYCWAALDEFGQYGQVSPVASTAANTSKSIRLTATPGVGTRIILWRSTGSADVLAAPSVFVRLWVPAGSTRIYDTGSQVNGRNWATTSVPVPNTVAAIDHTADAMKLNGTAVTIP